MFGRVSHELEIQVPASKAWALYGTLRLSRLCEEKFPIFEEIRLVEGDGGVGTILQLVIVPGVEGAHSCKEKFTKIDEEKRLKESEVIEGGFLELGFTLYRVRFEVIEKGEDDSACIVKSTIEYELNDELASNVSLVSIKSLEEIAKLAATYLVEDTSTNAL
ncbi:hypothetical protein Nepgr_020320 [Nepenthes gracilis]|uniref:Bet v I/Major latex protein domain-containing protein n=1 Tax=Nepenthes gracilis TaxID=150966 RepID=A0AAD3XVY2_NEPGR|nr:hypothetical protein Nepgr_020320 [Nepenthes gracilis]